MVALALCRIFALVNLALAAVRGTSAPDNEASREEETSYHEEVHQVRDRWASAAFDFLKNLTCDDVYFTSQKECLHLRGMRKRDASVYTAEAEANGQLLAVLPDESLGRTAAHDGVLVLDPHPDANFGHFIAVFYIDRHTTASSCRRQRGAYAGHSHCMTLALKSRCRNAVERGARVVYNAEAPARRLRKYAKRCEINFLPLVIQSTHFVVGGGMDLEPSRLYERSADVAIGGAEPQLQQLLHCRDDLTEFAPCPTLRPLNESTELICNPIRDNTRRCETSHETVRTRCRLFESCDQAVLVSGGWNRQHSLQRHKDSTIAAYHMFRLNGFQRDTVKVFFANGMAGGIPVLEDDEEPAEVFPASSKLALRSHIRKMCDTPHCVDTLVLYLNSPAKSDGSLLLWDVNGDGLADDNERYSSDELLQDVSTCVARHVLIIADQSYSGELAKAVRRSRDHSNVVVYASSREHEYSYANEFTRKWLAADHAHTCTNDIFQQIKSTMALSNPELGEVPKGGGSSSRVTIFGAPCDVDPPFTQRELRIYYRGCQNVPTEVWLRTFFIHSSSQRSSSHQSGDYVIPVFRPESLPETRIRKR